MNCIILTKKKKKFDFSKNIFVVGMIIVPLISFLVFFVYVNFSSIAMAFAVKGQNNTSKLGFDNFTMFFKDITLASSIFPMALKNTLIFFSVSLFLMVPLTMLLSFFLFKKIKGYKFFRIIFFVPSLISAVVMTMLYRYLVSVDGPIVYVLTHILGWTSKPELLADSRFAMTTIVLYGIWTGFGASLILFNGAMMRIPEEVLEAGRLDGVGLLRELFQIIIPMIWPTVSTIIIFSCVGLFSASGPILLFTPGPASETYKTTTISYWIFRQVYEGGNTNYASAVGLVFTAIGFPIVFGVRHFLTKMFPNIDY